ncbi:MAG TPA: MFS transporter [Gemmatimonadales bacterium]|jgi:MFS family permease
MSSPSFQLGGIGRALRHRNYRLFFMGQGTSVVGTWITRVATSWLVFRLTHSAVLLGVVNFAGQVPTFILSPLAGVWVDRLDRYKVLFVTQTLAMLQSFALAALALTGVIQVWHILALQVVQGMINAFDTPSRQSFLIEMVDDPADLSNAIALNSTMVNGARLIGPAIAGILISTVGEGWCFLIDGVSYLAVLDSLWLMRVAHRLREFRDTRVWDELIDGVRYATGFTPIRAILLLLTVTSIAGMPYSVLMPVVASDVLHSNAATYGFLMGAVGVGALIGALHLASRTSVRGLGRIVPMATMLFGGALVAFSASRNVFLSMGLLLLVGTGFMTQTAGSNTLLQTLVRPEMRGRVMAFYTMAIMGTMPFGALLAGALAQRIGAPDTILAGGLTCILAGAVFLRYLPKLREVIRPIYIERGIIPPPDGP